MNMCPRGECVCHRRGLNPWVEGCPMCGCVNPNFTTELSDEDRQFKEDMETFISNFGRL